jgi:hypothetical protein
LYPVNGEILRVEAVAGEGKLKRSDLTTMIVKSGVGSGAGSIHENRC